MRALIDFFVSQHKRRPFLSNNFYDESLSLSLSLMRDFSLIKILMIDVFSFSKTELNSKGKYLYFLLFKNH